MSYDSFDTKYLSAAGIALKLVLMYSISSITVHINNLVNVSEDGEYNSQLSHLYLLKTSHSKVHVHNTSTGISVAFINL